MRVIYADVLIVLNVYVNFFLLMITSEFTHSPLKKSRCIISSFYGSLYSLMILAPELPFIVNTAIKLTAAVTIVIMAFGYNGRKRLFIDSAAFLLANMILAGTVYAVYTWLKPNFIHFGNACFYVDFSLLILILTTAVLYAAVNIIKRITDSSPNDGNYKVFIRYGNNVIAVDGLSDTGNSLTDHFTGYPVIICSPEDIERLTGYEAESGELPEGFRLLPCMTVSESGLIPIFHPKEIIISNTDTGERKRVEAMAGCGKSNGKAIFNPKILKF